jgi:hypothetical protein
MIKDYIIIDNILDNPDEIVELSRNISYYSKEKQGIDGITIKDMRQHPGFSGSHWRGYRSDYLHEIDQGIFNKVFSTVVRKMLSAFDQNVNFRYIVESHLHFAPALIPYYDAWWHQDSGCLFAGVIYLTKNPEPESGTLLRLNGEEIVSENVFNRLVLYRSTIVHRPQKCFGDSIENCRLVIPMFFKEFCLKS